MTLQELKWHERAFYAFGKFLVHLLTLVMFPLSVEGRDNLPKTGAFIVIANHISMLEVFFLAKMIFPRRTVFMAKSELFEHGKLFNWVLNAVGAFPVKRGTADIGAIKKSLAILKADEVFGIFPEGTRNKKLDGNLQKFNTGVGYIALLSGAPIVPVLFQDTRGFKPFRKVRVLVGPPVDLSGIRGQGRMNSDMTDLATQKALDALHSLMSSGVSAAVAPQSI